MGKTKVGSAQGTIGEGRNPTIGEKSKLKLLPVSCAECLRVYSRSVPSRRRRWASLTDVLARAPPGPAAAWSRAQAAAAWPLAPPCRACGRRRRPCRYRPSLCCHCCRGLDGRAQASHLAQCRGHASPSARPANAQVVERRQQQPALVAPAGASRPARARPSPSSGSCCLLCCPLHLIPSLCSLPRGSRPPCGVCLVGRRREASRGTARAARSRSTRCASRRLWPRPRCQP